MAFIGSAHTCESGRGSAASSLPFSAAVATVTEGFGDVTDPLPEAVEFLRVRFLECRNTEFRSKCCLRNCMSSAAAGGKLVLWEVVVVFESLGSEAKGFLRSAEGSRPLFVVLLGKGLFLVVCGCGGGGRCLLCLLSSAWL